MFEKLKLILQRGPLEGHKKVSSSISQSGNVTFLSLSYHFRALSLGLLSSRAHSKITCHCCLQLFPPLSLVVQCRRQDAGPRASSALPLDASAPMSCPRLVSGNGLLGAWTTRWILVHKVKAWIRFAAQAAWPEQRALIMFSCWVPSEWRTATASVYGRRLCEGSPPSDALDRCLMWLLRWRSFAPLRRRWSRPTVHPHVLVFGTGNVVARRNVPEYLPSSDEHGDDSTDGFWRQKEFRPVPYAKRPMCSTTIRRAQRLIRRAREFHMMIGPLLEKPESPLMRGLQQSSSAGTNSGAWMFGARRASGTAMGPRGRNHHGDRRKHGFLELGPVSRFWLPIVLKKNCKFEKRTTQR